MLTCNIDSFYFTPEELEQSPSRAHGITSEQESCLRVYGAQMVQEAGILLKCPQVVMATGQILLQRFYCKRSLRDFSIKKLAAAATFLACKLEECTRVRVREIVMVFDRLWKRRDNAPLTLLEPGTKEYQAVKDSIIRYEREMLRVFGFIVHCDHPHKLLISFVKVLDGDQELIQEAWNIVNDSLRTPLCVLYKSEVVASGAIFYAARKLQIPLPESVPWWAAFSVKTEQLVAVVRTLYELYQKPKATYINVSQEALQPARKVAAETSPEEVSVPSQSGGPPANAPGAETAAGGGVEQAGTRDEKGREGGASPSSPAKEEKEEGVSGAEASGRGADGDAGPSMSGSREGVERDRDKERRERDRSRGGRSPSRDRGGTSGRDKEPSGRDRDRERGGRDRDRDWGRDRHKDRDRDRSQGMGRSRSRSRSRERGSGRERERAKERERERARERDVEKLRAREKEKERSSSRRDRDRDRDRGRDRERERDSRGSRAERERERERERELRERSIRVAQALRAEREKASVIRDESSRDGLPPGSYGSRPPAPSSSGRDAAPRGDSRPADTDSRQRGDSQQRSNSQQQHDRERESRQRHRDRSVQQGSSEPGGSSSGSGGSGSSSSGSASSGSEGSGGSRQEHHRHSRAHSHHSHHQAQSARQRAPAAVPTQEGAGKSNGGGHGPEPPRAGAELGSALLDKGRGLREDDPEDLDRMYESEEMEIDDDLGEVQNGVMH